MYPIGSIVTYTGPQVIAVMRGTKWTTQENLVRLAMRVETRRDSSGQIGLSLAAHAGAIAWWARQHELEAA